MQFSFDTMEEFDKHIGSSIPFFDAFREHTTSLASFYLKSQKPRVIDLGCSTGSLLLKFSKEFAHYNGAEFIGYDVSENIIKSIPNINSFNVNLFQKDITEEAFEPPAFDLAILSFTLQFLAIEARLPLLSKLRSAMKPLGAIMIAEKVFSPDSKTEEAISMAHYDFKLKTFSASEILEKQKDLRKIMAPLTEEQNLSMFYRAGFNTITPYWQSLNFKAWLLTN